MSSLQKLFERFKAATRIPSQRNAAETKCDSRAAHVTIMTSHGLAAVA
jgi:hypothetical protein